MTLIEFENILTSVKFASEFKGSAKDLYDRWNEPHRHFHTLSNHFERIISLIEKHKSEITVYKYDLLRIIAIYHDIVYLPRVDKLNVLASVEKFKQDFPDLPEDLSEVIIKGIMSTIDHDVNHPDSICRYFNQFDMYGIFHDKADDLIRDNTLLRKEYENAMDMEVFSTNNIKFLTSYIKYNSEIKKLIDHIKKSNINDYRED